MIEDKHATVSWDGYFSPFTQVFGDWSEEDFINRLRLRRVQQALFSELLHQFDFNIWFWESDEDSKPGSPGLELNCFAPGAVPDDKRHVSSCNLFDLLNDAFDRENTLGPEQEIVALEKLKALCEDAIKDRRDLIENKEQQQSTVPA